ncbi:ABC transporter permease/M1 family aminopeptidase [Niastella caeni]|nr:M1 family aminopeptidase [Niastella caeni]
MLFEIFKFEINYRIRQYNTYLYFIILFLFSIVAVDFIFEGQLGPLKRNAPIIIARTMGISSALLLMIPSMIMGVAVLRDFDHQMESLQFVNPIKKSDYLLGRFLGSFVILVFIFTAIPFGMMVGDRMPWHDPDKLIPFDFWHYLQPFLFLVVPTLFFSGSLFFVTGALSRKLLIVYIQGFFFLIVYLVAINLAKGSDNPFLTGLLEPFTFQTVPIVTSSWSVIERNTAIVPITGMLLYNRLLWIALGMLTLVIGHHLFSFHVVRDKAASRKKKKAGETENKKLNPCTMENQLQQAQSAPMPLVFPQTGIQANVVQLYHLTLFSYKSIVAAISFWAIVLCGMGILFINSFNLGTSYGVNNVPATYIIAGELVELTWIFFVAIILFYSGELVWKERDTRINLLFDTLPISNLINLSGKFLGLMLTLVLLIFTMIGTGMLFQSLHGYYEYELDVYFAAFFVEVFPFLILLGIVCFVSQVLVNNKYLAHLVVLIFIGISTVGCRVLGLDHGLITFGGSLLTTYSDMNGYGHFLKPYLWFKVYWISFSLLLFMIAVLFSVRGTEAGFRRRWQQSRVQLTAPVKRISMTAIIILILSGGYIFYNTNIVNRYASRATQHKYRAKYEQLLKPLTSLPQPRIAAVNLNLDLYPGERAYSVKGQYILFNPAEKAINEIHIQKLPADQVQLEYLTVEGGAILDSTYNYYGYHILKLNQPLQPGDSLKMEFKQHFTSIGFAERPNTFVVYNGTFLDNYHFPTIGYNQDIELEDATIRAEFGLKPQLKRAKINDSAALLEGKSNGDGEEIDFEIIVSTDYNQSVVAPGNLKKTWAEQGRRYFHFASDKPISNFYAILSARYEVLRKFWYPDKENIAMEIYYHSGHIFNLDRMMNGMKQSLGYYSKHFSPYQYQQMRIAETPAYSGRGQSFPGLISISENVGFIMDIDDTTDMDMPFFIVAHEMAHQWWGDQVNPANVQGKTMVSESLAQYSALMVFKKEFSEQKVKKLLRWNMRQYLKYRSGKAMHETPLSLVGSKQEYIHYNKGMINLNALQHYISEDSVNKALQRFIRDWNSYTGLKKQRTDRYPTTNDLLGYFRDVTADSMQHIIQDLFASVILYDNKLRHAEYEKVSEKQYSVTVTLDMKKMRIDSLGNENSAAIKDWIELGIYSEDVHGKENLVLLKKIMINSTQTTLKLFVPQKPAKVVLDPNLLLIDKNMADNEKSFNNL